MRKMNSLVVALSCMGLLAGAASAADMVENPAYAMWAKHKPGTSVTYKTETVIAMQGMPDPMKTESKSTQKLVEVKPEAAVVETTTETMGQSFSNKITIPAKIEKGKETPAPAGAEMKDIKEGKEKVEVAGKSYDAATKEYTMDMKEQGSTKVKTWTASDVPGGMVKMESNTTGPANTKMTMTLVEFKAGG